MSSIVSLLICFAREPLLQFVLVALLLSVYLPKGTDLANRIVISEDNIQKIAKNHERQFGLAPDEETLDHLIELFIQEEALYRQALALQLDKNDPVVRSRLIQKMRFVARNLDRPEAPEMSELMAFYQENQGRYRIPENVDFNHLFFQVDEDSKPGIQLDRAKNTLEALRLGLKDLDAGDDFIGSNSYQRMTFDQITRVFGAGDLSHRLFDAPAEQWSGPYRSAYGWHLTFVSRRTSPQLPPFSQVSERVFSDYSEMQGNEFARQAVESIVAEYTVVRAVDEAARR